MVPEHIWKACKIVEQDTCSGKLRLLEHNLETLIHYFVQNEDNQDIPMILTSFIGPPYSDSRLFTQLFCEYIKYKGNEWEKDIIKNDMRGFPFASSVQKGKSYEGHVTDEDDRMEQANKDCNERLGSKEGTVTVSANGGMFGDDDTNTEISDDFTVSTTYETRLNEEGANTDSITSFSSVDSTEDGSSCSNSMESRQNIVENGAFSPDDVSSGIYLWPEVTKFCGEKKRLLVMHVYDIQENNDEARISAPLNMLVATMCSRMVDVTYRQMSVYATLQEMVSTPNYEFIRESLCKNVIHIYRDCQIQNRDALKISKGNEPDNPPRSNASMSTIDIVTPHHCIAVKTAAKHITKEDAIMSRVLDDGTTVINATNLKIFFEQSIAKVNDCIAPGEDTVPLIQDKVMQNKLTLYRESRQHAPELPLKLGTCDLPLKRNTSELPFKENKPALSLQRDTSDLLLTRDTSDLPLKQNMPALSLQRDTFDLIHTLNTLDLPLKQNMADVSLQLEASDLILTRNTSDLPLKRETSVLPLPRDISESHITKGISNLPVQRESSDLPFKKDTTNLLPVHDISDLSLKRETSNDHFTRGISDLSLHVGETSYLPLKRETSDRPLLPDISDLSITSATTNLPLGSSGLESTCVPEHSYLYNEHDIFQQDTGIQGCMVEDSQVFDQKASPIPMDICLMNEIKAATEIGERIKQDIRDGSILFKSRLARELALERVDEALNPLERPNIRPKDVQMQQKILKSLALEYNLRTR